MLQCKTVVGGFVAVLLCTASSIQAQEYETRVIARGLQQPTGIVVEDRTTLYFTQLPTPGVSGANGGRNTVSELNIPSGQVRDLVNGEPEPTNLSVDIFGNLFWTCKSAGVVNALRRRGGVETILRNLAEPSGIAVYPLGFFLVFTEVPTPGINAANGGLNRVSRALIRPGLIQALDIGDPEPTDVAVALNGDVYWTCTSAGVIVRLSRGNAEVILRGLERPTGIALDQVGNLYFTEVPTPGVSGANGGSNAVYKYDLIAKKLTLIDAGDPEPTDVSALPNGTVYWTCTSAGVIVEATPIR